MEEVYLKDPDAVLDFAIDWATSWLATSEAVSTYSVTVDSTLLTISTHGESSGVVTAWLSGGTVNQDYTVSIKIVTDASRTDERSFRVLIRER